MNVDELINEFNDGQTDFLKFFGGDVKVFFSFLERRNRLQEIDPKSIDSGDWQNSYLIWLYDKDKSKFYELVLDMVSDLHFVDGTAILTLDDRGDLYQFFCFRDRNGISRETVENILSGESDYWDYFDYDSENIYRDVVDELTDGNLEHLKKAIIEKLKDTQLNTETELLERIAEYQGHPEYVIVDESIISDILKDEETTNFVMDECDLTSDLDSVYRNAQNSAYETTLYDGIINELDDYFVMNKGNFVSKSKYGGTKIGQYYEVPVRDFDKVILDYLKDGESAGERYTIDYHGSIFDIMERMVQDGSLQCLSYHSPDYPDSDHVTENINEFIKDYI
jgi:hypothetical protein